MKKTTTWIFVILLLAALVGCNKKTESNESNETKDGNAQANSVLSVTDETAEILVNGAAAPTAEPVETTPDPNHTPLPEYATDTPEPTPYTGIFGTTLISRNMVNGVQENTYYNETLDFSRLQVEILSFDPASATEALRLKITMPEDWTDTVQSWMRKEGLRLRFAVDGRNVDGFRQRELRFEEGSNTFEITYKQCILDEYDLSGTTLTVTPFVEEYIWIASCEPDENENAVRFYLQNGDTFIQDYNLKDVSQSRRKALYTECEKHYLTAVTASVNLPKSGTEKSRPSDINTVTFAIDDVEKNSELGVYTTDPYIGPIYCTFYQRTLDFSKASLTLDTFHIWEEETALAFTWTFPEEWTDLECAGMYHELYFFVYAGKDETLTYEDWYTRRSMFSFKRDDRSALSSASGAFLQMHLCPEPDSSIGGHRTISFRSWETTLPVEKWKEIECITIIPYYLPDQNGEEEFPEDGVWMNWFDVDWAHDDYVFLYDQAITVEITPDLFETGY